MHMHTVSRKIRPLRLRRQRERKLYHYNSFDTFITHDIMLSSSSFVTPNVSKSVALHVLEIIAIAVLGWGCDPQSSERGRGWYCSTERL